MSMHTPFLTKTGTLLLFLTGCLPIAKAPEPVVVETTPPRLEWIDVHMHLIGGNEGSAGYASAARSAIEAMDEAGIRKSIVIPPPQNHEIKSPYDIDAFQAALDAYPGRFEVLGGGGTLNTMLQEHAGETTVDLETRREFVREAQDILAEGAIGFGEIAAHHLSLADGHPYESVAADHPLLLDLAELSARTGAPIDLHLDGVVRDMHLPPRFSTSNNPAQLEENLFAFERLLDHAPDAKIIWSHAGSDPLAGRSPELVRDLLERHPNLYMSLRFPANMVLNHGTPPIWANHLAMDGEGDIDPRWLRLVCEFPDRFVFGGDQFIVSPTLSGSGPGLKFATASGVQRDLTRTFIEALPRDVARKVAFANAKQIYSL